MNLKATNKTETNKYELEVEISAEDFNKALSEVAKTEGKKMSVPGFRKGHAPRSVIEKMYGENVFFEAAVDKLYRPAMQDAIEASGLEVIAVSNADVTSVSRENGIELKLTVVVKPVITIEGYKGIEATKKNVEVTDEDVSAELVKVQDRNSRMVDVDNRGALTGDTAVIDFEGFCDGKAFEGGKAEGFELSLGSGQFIPGFEDQIVGHEVGDGARRVEFTGAACRLEFLEDRLVDVAEGVHIVVALEVDGVDDVDDLAQQHAVLHVLVRLLEHRLDNALLLGHVRGNREILECAEELRDEVQELFARAGRAAAVVMGPVPPAVGLGDDGLVVIFIHFPVLFLGVIDLEEERPDNLLDALGVAVDAGVVAHDVLKPFDESA